MKKRGALSLWKTLILVFCSLLGVCGLALLGTYLTGGFNKNVIQPNDISFSHDISGDGTYDEQSNTFKVVDDFRMTITTNTADVTEKVVNLSLTGGKAENGYITNQVIKIPEKVKLNESFQVELIRDEDGWIKGGNTTIRAQSDSNKLLETIKTYVAVDTPVSGIKVSVRGDKAVVANNNFWVDTTFDKPNSRYNYNNTQNTKTLFYMPSSENDIEIVDLKNGIFKASESTGEYTITVYTFINAYLENKFLQENAGLSGTALNTRFFTNYLSSHANDCVSKSVNVNVTKASVNSVTITNNLSLQANTDTIFRLTAHGEDQTHSLGLTITDDDGNSDLANLFGKVGIKIPNDPYFTISGGDIMKVSADGIITAVKEVDNEAGASFYVLPKLGDGPENYNWALSSSQENASIILNVNFFSFSSNTGYSKLYSDAEEKTFVFGTKPLDERPLEWESTTPITMTIHYNNNLTIADEYDLKNSAVKLGNNIYREYKYFLVADSSAVDLSEIFLTKDNGKLYTQNFKGESFTLGSLDGTNGYVLYELEQEKLTALKSYSGTAYLVAATIKTDINGRPEMFTNDDGQSCFKLVAFTTLKSITVNSTLNVNDMTAQFAFDDVFDIENNETYIPTLNRDDNGNQKKVLTFKFFMDTTAGTKSKDAVKIENAFGDGADETLRLEIRDVNGTKILNYLKLKDLKPVETGDDTRLEYEAELQIDESLVGTSEDWQNGIAVYPYLVYVDDMGNTSSLKITGNMDEGTGATVTTDHFVLYTQIAKSLVGNYETEGYTDGIDVVMTTEKTTIKWGANDSLTLATLNDLLNFTIFDQKNSDIAVSSSAESIYRYRFEEITQAGKNPILSLRTSTIAGFVSTRGEKISTTLKVVVEKLTKISETESEYREVEGLSKQIEFSVSSEGVSTVKQSTSKTIGLDTTFENSPNIATAKVAKYTTSTGGSEINVADLIQVYTTTQGQETETQIQNGITYQIDETSFATTSAKQDILKMISLVALDSADTPTNVTSIDNWAGINLSKIMILNPFGVDTTIKILAKHKLFAEDIVIELTLLSDIKFAVNGSTPTFDVYYNQNSEYMVKNGALYSLFADEQYKLDDYAELASKSGNYEYSWKTNSTNISDLITSNSETIISLGRYAGTNELYLDIKPVYTFTSVTNIVIYYGIKTEFTFKMRLNIYINPNYVAVQKNGEDFDASHIDLSNMTLSNLSEYYAFFKYTDSVSKDGFKEKGLQATPLNNVLRFDNTAKNDVTSNKNFVSISNLTTSGGGAFGYVENRLDLEIGETVEQSFYVSIVENGQNQNINGLVITSDGEKQVVTFDNTDTMKLVFNVGFGDNDVNVMAGQIFNKNASTTDGSTSAVPTVVNFNETPNLLFYRGESYTVFDDFSIEQVSNANLSIGQKTIKVLDSYTSFVTETGNQIRVSKTFDGLLTVNLELNAIVTQLEKQLVYYEKFANVDWSWFIGDYQKLLPQVDENGNSDNGIYQEIVAGNSYEILHDTYGVTANYKQAGFFFNSLFATTNANLGNKKASLTLSVVENQTIDGQKVAEIKDNKTLVLKDISNEFDNVYIVLQLKFEVDGSSINKSIFYRIKVVSDFELGTVNYPYSTEGEYLNENSAYYKDGVYVIDMEEKLDNSNSKYTDSKRLSDLTTNVENVTFKYAVKDVFVNGSRVENFGEFVSFSIVGSEIKITPKTELPFQVIVERKFYHNDAMMLGSAMQYILLFNQSPVYSEKVEQNGTRLENVENTNIYNATVRAGTNETEFTTLVYDGSTSVENLVTEYDAYLSGENIENYLHQYFVIEEGTKYYNVQNSSLETFDNTVGFDTTKYIITHTEDSLNGQDVFVKVTVTNKNDVTDNHIYYLADVTKSQVENFYQYFYLSNSETTENAKVLHITPNETISKDNNFEIGFYSDKCVMFRINLLVTCRYVINITNEEMVGGNEYNFSEIVNSITDVNGNNVLGDDVSYTILISDNETNKDKLLLSENTISFAELQENTTFKLTVQITEGENVYTDEFEITVKQSFTLNKPTISGQNRYSGDTFEIDIESDEFKKYFAKQTEYEAYSLSPTEIVTTKSITNDNVEADKDMTESLIVYYFFASSVTVEEDGTVIPNFDKPLFSFNATYSYKVLMNVKLTANYPVPNSTAKLEVEYVGTTLNSTTNQFESIKFEDYFASIAPFGKASRIGIQDLGLAENGTRQHEISVLISNIENAKVNVTTPDGRLKTYSNAGVEIVGGVNSFDDIDVNFVLVNTSIGNGNVEFTVTVNSVDVVYKVEILSTDIISVTPNATNYDDAKETIYLDEYASQEQELFKDDRILKFTLKENFTAGTYYLRLHNKATGEYQTEELKITSTNKGTVNYDLGRSYKGYDITGVYTNGSFTNEATIFEDDGQPKLTSRIIVIYYGGLDVEFDDDTQFILINKDGETETETSKDTFALTINDYEKTKSVQAKVSTNGIEFKLSSFVYNLYLDIAFDVEKAVVDIDKYDYVSINAGTRKTLLGTSSQNGLADLFGIKNKKTGQYYSSQDIQNSDATLGLWIYGLVPSEGNTGYGKINVALRSENKIAYGLHEKLRSTAIKEGDFEIIYKNGLAPRNVDLGNTDEFDDGYVKGGSQEFNFMDYQPTMVSNRNVDYTLIANGANNDGNFVLMRLAYSAKIGEQYLSKTFDILFKVEPNSKVDMKISPTSDPSETNVKQVNNQRVNYNNGVYEIIDKDLKEEEKRIVLTDVLSAKMYGSNVSSSNKFKFTYQKNIETNYNKDSIEANNYINWENSNNTVIKIKKIDLGARNYVITMENGFGYKARFYFRLVASNNPTISASDSTTVFTEGNKVVFGGLFHKVREEGMTSYQFLYEEGKTSITVPQNIITGYTLQTTTVSHGTLTRTVSSGFSGNSIGLTGKYYDSKNTEVEINDASSFTGCEFYLSLKVGRQETEANSPTMFSVSYGGTVLKTGEHVIGVEEKATIGDENTDVVFLKDIDAYAYSNLLKGIDENSCRKSKVNGYQVVGIEFLIDGKNNGNPVAAVNVENGKNGVQLVTGSKYSFVETNLLAVKGYDFNKDAAATGGISVDGNYMIIPKIDGIYYGTKNYVDVTMNVTIKLGTETAVISRDVKVQRQDDNDLFANANLSSGYYEVNNGDYIVAKTGLNLINDTLEVVLEKDESVKFKISVDGVSSDVLELTNSYDYTITEYVGITRNLKGLSSNLMTSSRITIEETDCVGRPRYYYNGAEIFKNHNANDNKGTFTIQNYTDNSIQLNINSKQELMGSNFKTTTLYFLNSVTEEIDGNVKTYVYQKEANFRVYRLYNMAGTTETTTIIKDYIKVTSGTQTSYAIPFESWASFVRLIPCYSVNGNILPTLLSTKSPYAFAFETTKGSSVDKATGLIVTDANIQIAAYRFSVKLYLKVSGNNGQFEDDQNLIQLGEFEFMLDETATFNNAVVNIDENGGVIQVNNVANPAIMVANYGTPAQVYTCANSAISVSLLNHSTENVADGIYTIPVNTSVDASIASENTTGFNKSYRIVAIDGKYISNPNHVFTKSGKYTVTIAVNLRKANENKYTTEYVNKTVWVYDRQSEDDIYQITVDSTSGSSSYDLNNILSGGTWYELNQSGKIAELTSSNVFLEPSSNKLKDYIFVKDGVAKHITVSFFAYNEVVDKKVMITNNTSAFDLNLISDLKDRQIYKVIDDLHMKLTGMETSFNKIGEYIITGKNANNDEEIVYKYRVDFVKVQDNTTLLNMTVSSTENFETQLNNLVQENLDSKNIVCDEFEIFEVTNKIFLEKPKFVIPDSHEENTLSVDYLVQYKQGGTIAGNFKIRISFTIYSLAVNLEYEMSSVGLVYLTSLDEMLLDEINRLQGESLPSSEVKYYDEKGNLRETNIRIINFPTMAKYYVEIGGKYFFLTVTFTTPATDDGV